MSALFCIQSVNAILGESPCWDASRRVLYWVDGKRPAIFCWDPEVGQTGHWPMPKPIGCVAKATGERLIFADADGLGLLNVETGSISRIANPDGHLPENQFNDGKVDAAGRFWAGTMHVKEREPSGSMYRLDQDLSIHRLDSGFICSNGLGWSPDNGTMYYTDSLVRTIWAYEFDLTTGELGTRRVFARLAPNDGLPDGLAVDSAGYVWSAIWDGWRLIRYAPDGAIDREIRMPVQRPTSCAFGGKELKTLFITSASEQLSRHHLKAGPLAGSLFGLKTEIPGLPSTSFAGVTPAGQP